MPSSSKGQVASKAGSHHAPWFHFSPVSPMTNSLQRSNFVLSKTARCDPGCWVRRGLEHPYRARSRMKTSLAKPARVSLFFSFSCSGEATTVLCRNARDWDSRVFTAPFVLYWKQKRFGHPLMWT